MVCRADAISAHQVPRNSHEILPPKGRRFCALQLRNENANPQICRSILGYAPEPRSSACNIAAFFAVRITVRKCVGLYGLART